MGRGVGQILPLVLTGLHQGLVLFMELVQRASCQVTSWRWRALGKIEREARRTDENLRD